MPKCSGCRRRDLEIGCALVGDALRLVLDRGPALAIVGDRLKQRLEPRAVGVLGLFADRRLAQRREISVEDVPVSHPQRPS
jgi:hypothetical protein